MKFRLMCLIDLLKYFKKDLFKITLLATLLMVFVQTEIIKSQSPEDNIGNFQVAFSTNVFKGVYLNDATAGAKALTETLIKEYSRKQYEVIPPATFTTVKELESLLKLEEVEVLIMHATEFLQVKNSDIVEPICVAVRDGSPYDIFYLLVNKKSNYKKIEDLKGKKLLVGSPFEGDIPVIWMDKLLKQKKLKQKDKYFSKIEYFDNALPAILPVFFNKADACIMTKSLFETVAELNPQLSEELTTIEISQPISIGLVTIRKNISSQDLKDDIKNAFLNLHKTANGSQYLNIFRIEKVIEFKEEYLLSTYKLLEISKK
ncbi:MAG: PhnD/SsuA/transferrin family substrate-binding protein [Ignavibacteria bacterium]|nr:PhnD/SsuA/transferrin family substrate-binding protein [Ignavibacteria bacterium]